MDNTIDNQTRFMALYLGTTTVRHKQWETRKTEILTHIRLQDEYYLELTPLSAITDEDAIEVAKLNPWADYRDGMDKEPYIEHVKGFIFNDNHLLSSYADYLRSRGYALPYLDASVEDLVKMGWVKLKEQTT